MRDRLPAGSTAVLISRAHRFAGLVLPINRFEERVLGAIDGRRTLDDVLAAAAPDVADEHRALAFVERLWQYEHIVFDASRASAEAALGSF